MDKDIKVMLTCETDGFDEATEKVQTLADAYNEFPPQVQIKGCRYCTINVHPSQTKFIQIGPDEDTAETE